MTGIRSRCFCLFAFFQCYCNGLVTYIRGKACYSLFTSVVHFRVAVSGNRYRNFIGDRCDIQIAIYHHNFNIVVIIRRYYKIVLCQLHCILTDIRSRRLCLFAFCKRYVNGLITYICGKAGCSLLTSVVHL